MTPPRSLSLWHDTLPADELERRRPALTGRVEADVAVVGAGFTGLWTAHSLACRDPGLRVVVLEREFAGFGASGRNGGWLSGLLPVEHDAVAAASSPAAAAAWQRAAWHTVDDVLRVADAEGIDARADRGGHLCLARSEPQARRLLAEVAGARRRGVAEEDLRWLSRAEARERVAADGVFGATFTPHCAALDPARLVRGLAEAVERRGVVVHEGTPVTEIAPHRVRTAAGEVRAGVVVRALEGYTPALPGHRRTLLPVHSLVLATEPLPEGSWAEVGWRGRETLNDARRLLLYAQRTRDGRIVFGGRGAPYRFGSRTSGGAEHARGVHDALRRSLAELFPALAGVRVTHRWGGVLGVPRDGWPSVGLDPGTGLAHAGGYSGDGVALAALAGRTLADLVTGRDSELVRLPWVGHRSPRFEPEPLRWLGVNAGIRLAGLIDDRERRTGRPARLLDRAMTALTGH
ncbi:NAD(P)/FAD-dependent oxidoreductase [Geodermatophilus sp. SYSU D01105]